MPRRPDDEDLEDFIGQVNDIEKTIKALMDGSIDPIEVDKKEEAFKEKQRKAVERKRKKKEDEDRMRRHLVRQGERKKWGFVGRWCPRCRKDEVEMMEEVHGKDDTKWPMLEFDKCITHSCRGVNDGEGVVLLSNEERRKQLEGKVELLKQDRLQRAQAKDRWQRWQSTQKYKRAGAAETDYQRWDRWMPSDDEEDELPPLPPPDTADFKAMETDINERAADKEKRRRKAEEYKIKGNAFFADGEYKKAFKQYTEGLEHDKGNKACLTNRALCALRLKNKRVTVCKLGEDVKVESYQQAVDDCTKVLDICEYLHSNAGPGITDARLKGYMRRAEAHSLMGNTEKAIEDVKTALGDIENLAKKSRDELEALLKRYEEDCEEKIKLEGLRKMAGIEEKVDKKEETERILSGESVDGEKEKKTANNAGFSDNQKDAAKTSIDLEDQAPKEPVLKVQEDAMTCAAKEKEVAEELAAAEKAAKILAYKNEASKVRAFKEGENVKPREGEKGGRNSEGALKKEMRKLVVEEDDDDDEDTPVLRRLDNNTTNTRNKNKNSKNENRRQAAQDAKSSKLKKDIEGELKDMLGEEVHDDDFIDRMKNLVGDPEMLAALKDQRFIQLMEEMQNGGQPLTDEEIMKRYKGDRDITKLYDKVKNAIGAAQPRLHPVSKDMDIDPAMIQHMKQDPDFQAALQNPKMQSMFQDLLRDPSSLQKFQDDPEFRKLEDKLAKTIKMDIKEPASTSQSLPTIRPEERLRGVVAMVNGIKNALEGGVGASKEACARAAASLMDKGPQLLVDEDARSLFRDQGGCTLVCDCVLSMGANAQMAESALQTLTLLSERERDAAVLLSHKRGKVLVQVLAWMQGLSANADLRTSAAQVLDVALQHEAIRKALAGKTWSYTPPGEGQEAQKVSVVSAACSLLEMRNAGAEMLAAAVLTNLAYEEKGKEVLTAWEKPKIACVFVGMAKRGVTQAVRVLLNMSTHPPFRRKIAEEARSLKDLVAALEMGDKESVELLMGLMTNLSLDDDLAAGLVDAGAISGMTRPISTIDVSSPVGLTDQRIASLVARLARIPAGARAVRREGILDVVIVMIERAKTCKGDYAQGVTEACVRSIAQSVRADSECASALVDSPLGVISCLLGLLKDSGDAVVGNAALALQVVANDDKNIEALGKAGAVPVLLEVVHHRRGQAQKNAALALARVVKVDKYMKALRALHGVEILNAYLKL